MTNHLWQSTLFAGVAGLLTVALRKNRAQVRYWLWLSASLKFLVPFSLLLGLGSHLQWTPAALKIAATPAVAVPMVQITAPFPETTPMATSTPPRTDWTPFAILGIWMCGAGAIALIRFRGWLRIRAAVRASVPIEIRVRRGSIFSRPFGTRRSRMAAAHPAPARRDRGTPDAASTGRSAGARASHVAAATTFSLQFPCWSKRCSGFIPWCGGSERGVEERERACDKRRC